MIIASGLEDAVEAFVSADFFPVGFLFTLATGVRLEYRRTDEYILVLSEL